MVANIPKRNFQSSVSHIYFLIRLINYFFLGKIKEAVIDARNTISEVLHLTHSDETIESLTKSNEKLVKEVAALREAVLSLTTQSGVSTSVSFFKINISLPFEILKI